MMLAYRRGLLKPDYPNGLQSRLREHMILNMLDAELTANTMLQASLIQAAAWAPAIDPKYAKDFVKGLMDKVVYAASKSEYDDVVYHSQAEIDRKFDEQAIKWFEAIRGKTNEASD